MSTTLAPPRPTHGQVQLAGWALWDDRCRAVDDARAALATGDGWDRPRLQQALIDLAAAAEGLASRMEPPGISEAMRRAAESRAA